MRVRIEGFWSTIATALPASGVLRLPLAHMPLLRLGDVEHVRDLGRREVREGE